MTTAHTPEDPSTTPEPSKRRRALSAAISTSLIAGLGPQGLQALHEARIQLEDRLAEISAGRFAVGCWIDLDGDVMSLRIQIRPEQPAAGGLDAPAAGLDPSELTAKSWPEDY